MFRLGLVLSGGGCRSFLRELQCASVLRAGGNQGAETREAPEGFPPGVASPAGRHCLAGSGSSAASGSCRWLWHLWHLGAGAVWAIVRFSQGAVPSWGGLGESKEPKEPESREVSEAVPVCSTRKRGRQKGLQAAPWRGAVPGPAALMADPLLTVTSQAATGAERREEPRRGNRQRDTAASDPQQCLLEALSLLSRDDW